jgi:hypothetical protein
MSAVNRNLRHSSRSSHLVYRPRNKQEARDQFLLLCVVTLSQDFLAFAHQMSAENFDKWFIPIAYVVISVRRSVPSAVNQSLVVAPVLKRLDYGNAAQAGLPSYMHRRLLSVLDAAT